MSAESTTWLVPDGWMPPRGTGEVEGHEAICVLNIGDQDAAVTLTFYFEDRDPDVVGPLACGARRTRHFRLDAADEIDGYVLAPETPYALVIETDVPVTVQHTRVDTRSPKLALMTSTAVAAGPGVSQ
jgi:hypothetical protein